ncbi:MAG TPA: hypothetical protein PK819_14390, partial [Thermomicrobiales bacterium]|nr:hypothetical protein [Thermomicrobiales bacterium]
GFPSVILISVTTDGQTWVPVTVAPEWTEDGWGAVSVDATITGVRITVPNADGSAGSAGIAEISIRAPALTEEDP